MNITDCLGEPRPVQDWIDEARVNPGNRFWLVFDSALTVEEISLATPLRSVTVNSRDLSDDEYEEFEKAMLENGFSYLLNMEQIEDVIQNYTARRPQHTAQDLLFALVYYVRNDAFVPLQAE